MDREMLGVFWHLGGSVPTNAWPVEELVVSWGELSDTLGAGGITLQQSFTEGNDI